MSEIERTLLIADLSGYTALTETHGAMHASEIALRFGVIKKPARAGAYTHAIWEMAQKIK